MALKHEGLHCGACGKDFFKTSELSSHLDLCRAAKVLLPMVNQVSICGADRMGHPIAGLIVGIAKSNRLIHKYAASIAHEMDTFKRAEIHRELCMSLGVPKHKFAPFESSKITKVPSIEEAEDILWKAIEDLKYTL